MARATKPTYKQKKVLSKFELNPKDYLVVVDNSNELKVVSKGDGTTKTLKKSS